MMTRRRGILSTVATTKYGLRILVTVAQLAIVVVVLLLWEYLPKISSVRELGNLFDPFFISSPSRIADRLYDLLVGNETLRGPMWKYLGNTLAASTIGLAIGLVTGGAVGLIVGGSRFLGLVIRPFLVAINAVPRIAFIPIVVVLMGATLSSSVVISLLVVFFIAFFNAFEGATSVPHALIENARILGGDKTAVLVKIRLPYVVAWTLAALPIAATFSLLAVVTGEILTGYEGLGRVIAESQTAADATLTFSVVIILAVIGLLVVGVAELMKHRLLHWWGR